MKPRVPQLAVFALIVFALALVSTHPSRGDSAGEAQAAGEPSQQQVVQTAARPERDRLNELIQQAGSAKTQGRLGDAIPRLEEALALAEHLQDAEMTAELAYDLGLTHAHLRAPDSAIPWIQRASEIHRRLGARLRALLEEAFVAGLQTPQIGPIAAAQRIAGLRAEIAEMRAGKQSVRVTGLKYHVGVFPPPLNEIVLREDPERLPFDGLGGVALSVVESSLLDMEAGFYLAAGELEEAGLLLDRLAELGEREAGPVFVALAAMGQCVIARGQGHLDRALALCIRAVEEIALAPARSEPARQILQPFCSQMHGALAGVHRDRREFDLAVATQQKAVDCASVFDPCSQAMARLERAQILIQQGRFRQVAEASEASQLQMTVAKDCSGMVAQALAIQAIAHIAMGELGQAQGLAEEAIQIAEASGHPPWIALAWLSRSMIAQSLGDDASIGIAKGKLARHDPTGEVTGGFAEGLSWWACLKRSRSPEACGSNPFAEPSNPQSELALTLLDLLLTPRPPQELAKSLEELLRSAERSGSILEEAVVLSVQALVAFVGGRDEVAAQRLHEAHRLFVEANLDPTMFYAILGELQNRLGRSDDADSSFQTAIARLEQLAAGLRSDLSRLQFFSGGHQAIYRHLAGLRINGEQTDLAFEAVEAASQRVLLEGVAGARRSPDPSDPQDVEEQAVVRTLDEEIASARQALRRLNADDAGVAPRRQENEPRALARQRLLDLLRRREEATDELVTERLNPTASLEAAQRALAADETLIRYFYLDENRLIAWVVRRDSSRFQELDAERIAPEDIACVASRRSVSGSLRGSERLVPNACNPRDAARALHHGLIEPLGEEPFSGPLLIVPSGPLHRLPFAALLDRKQRYLIESVPIGYLPSASILLALRRLETVTRADRAVVIGNPAGRPHLRFASEEARRVARLLDAELILGDHATEAKVRQALEDPGIAQFLFAGHGLFEPEQSAFSRLFLRPPSESAAETHDGVLDAFEVAREIRLPQAQLVTLSGCETGRSELTAGEEALGLPRAFLLAGARRVVATQWRIDDAASAELMMRFYQELVDGTSPLEALRQAQLQLLAKPETADPENWAAFFHLGDPAPWGAARSRRP